MGCCNSISPDLLLEEDQLFHGIFKGTLIFVNKSASNCKLDRPARVTLQSRASLRTIDKDYGTHTDVHVGTIWKYGGDIAKAGTILVPGENRFDFEFPLEGKSFGAKHPPLDSALVWRKKMGIRFHYVKYDYVVRAGSPPQTADIVRYPKLLPDGEDGIRVIRAINGGSALAEAAEGVENLMDLMDAASAMMSM